MRHHDLVNAVERLVEDTCADSVINALAAVCAAKITSDPDFAMEWRKLADIIAKVPNLGV